MRGSAWGAWRSIEACRSMSPCTGWPLRLFGPSGRTPSVTPLALLATSARRRAVNLAHHLPGTRLPEAERKARRPAGASRRQSTWGHGSTIGPSGGAAPPPSAARSPGGGRDPPSPRGKGLAMREIAAHTGLHPVSGAKRLRCLALRARPPPPRKVTDAQFLALAPGGLRGAELTARAGLCRSDVSNRLAALSWRGLLPAPASPARAETYSARVHIGQCHLAAAPNPEGCPGRSGGREPPVRGMEGPPCWARPGASHLRPVTWAGPATPPRQGRGGAHPPGL